MGTVSTALASHAVVAPDESRRVAAERAPVAAMTGEALDAADVRSDACQLLAKLAIPCLELSGGEGIAHGFRLVAGLLSGWLGAAPLRRPG